MVGKNDDAVWSGAKPYTRGFLTIYDVWVLRLSSRFAWRCPAEQLLGLYGANVSDRHLEVGPGSGWFLAHTRLPGSVTLLDLNPTPLEFAAKRLSAADVDTVVGSVLEPVPAAAGRGYRSIGINYVLHCVPGVWDEKGVAFRHLAAVLDDDGVLFGSTVLGGPGKNLFGSALMAVYNRIGAFGNANDDEAGLRRALGAAFADVEITRCGDVALFVARGPVEVRRSSS